MKNSTIFLFLLILATQSCLTAMNNENDQSSQISKEYADKTVVLLTNFWINNLTLISLSKSRHEKSIIAKQLFIIAKQIKKIKVSDENTFSVITQWHRAIERTHFLDIEQDFHLTKFRDTNRSIITALERIYSEITKKSYR